MNSFDLFGNPKSRRQVNESSSYKDSSYIEPIPETEGVVEEDIQEPRSFLSISIILGVVVAVLAVQCFQLQVRHGEVNRALAEGNSVRILTIQPDRGLIVDANGKILAQNTRHLALAINPQTLPLKKSDRESIYVLLREKAGVTEEEIRFIEANRLKSPEPFAVRTNLSKDESLLFSEWFADILGVEIQAVPIRQYASLPSFAQLGGYVGAVDDKDLENGYALNQRVGKSGLEKVYNTELTGTPGKRRAEINARGEVVGELPGSENLAVPGKTLKLSIDSRLQTIVADALRHEIERRSKKFGESPKLGASAVVMDPATGAIKAMVSLPDYDPQLFAKGITQKEYQDLLNNPGNPLLNRAIQGQFAPGSTFKPIVGAAGLASGVITAKTQFVTPRVIRIGRFEFPDWTDHSNGPTDIYRAIRESNNIFFYATAGGWEERNFSGMGIDRLNEYLRRFGFGNRLGIDTTGELPGLIGDDAYKRSRFDERWFIGDTYHTAIGQGYTLATPLQMASATSTIANGGTVWKPTLAWSFIDPVTSEEVLLPRVALDQSFVAPEHLATIREGMRQTVATGSGRPLNRLSVTSAGKTGTAQFGNEGRTHAWYTGFAPFENPQIAFSILIEGGGDSYYSSVPVAEEILRGYFNDPLEPGEQLHGDPRFATPATSEFQGE